MADVLNPIAPPQTMSASPVAPVAIQPPATQPVPVDPVPVTRSVINANPVTQIDDAVAKGDAVALDSFAQRYKNTPEGQASANLAQQVKKGQEEAARIFKDIDPNTPEGRLKALQTYKTVKDEPRYGDALMLYMAGDKVGGVQMIMGGKPTTTTEYLKNTGRQLAVTRNALGQLVSVVDQESGQVIPSTEYAKLGGSVSSLEATLKYQSDKATQEFRTKEFNNSTRAFNGLDTLAKAKDPLVNTYNGLMLEIMDEPSIGMEDRKLIAGFTSGQTQFTRNYSAAKQFIESAANTKGETLSLENRKALGLKADGKIERADLEKALALNGDVSLKDAAGNSFSTNTLLQAMKTKNVSEGVEKNTSQTKQALEESVIANLYKDKPVLYNKIKSAIELNGQIQALNAQGTAEHGNPLFTVPTTAASFTDPTQKVLAQAIQERFNVETTIEFNQWRKKQMEMARKAGDDNFYPEPGELESKFTETPYYKNKQREARNQIVSTLNRPSRIDETKGQTSFIPAESSVVTTKQASSTPTTIGEDKSPVAGAAADDAAKRKKAARDAARKSHTRQE
jgi:YD repeat-containing protein